MFDFLDGKKTYLGAIGAAILGIYYFLNKDQAHALELFSLALGVAGLRHAIEKAS